jgi:hypothetical protein
MERDNEAIKVKFSSAANSVAELFRLMQRSQNGLYEKGKGDAFVELHTFCQNNSDKNGKIDQFIIKAFIEAKIKELTEKDQLVPCSYNQ